MFSAVAHDVSGSYVVVVGAQVVLMLLLFRLKLGADVLLFLCC